MNALPALEELDLSNNKITHVPDMGRCKKVSSKKHLIQLLIKNFWLVLCGEAGRVSQISELLWLWSFLLFCFCASQTLHNIAIFPTFSHHSNLNKPDKGWYLASQNVFSQRNISFFTLNSPMISYQSLIIPLHLV